MNPLMRAGEALKWVWVQRMGQLKRLTGTVKFKIVAATEMDGGVGRKNDLPWPRLTEDMKHFRDLTMGHPVILGRKTRDSIPGGLKGRRMIVLTHKGREGVTDQHLLEHALNEAAYHSTGVVWIIGGPALWAQCFELDVVDEVVMTMINQRYHHDQVFPYASMHKAMENPLKAWACVNHRPLATNPDGSVYATVGTYRKEDLWPCS